MIMDYLEKYIELIQVAQDRESPSGYTEKHHILPRSWWDNNYLVALTAEEHFLAHYYLFKAFPEDESMTHAFWCMSNGYGGRNYKVEAKIFAEAREANAKLVSKRMKGKFVSEDTKEKLRALPRSGIDNPRADRTVYRFYHDKHGEFEGTRAAICKKFNLNQRSVGPLVLTFLALEDNGDFPHVIKHNFKGWRMRKEKYKVVCEHCGYKADPRIFSIHKKKCNP